MLSTVLVLKRTIATVLAAQVLILLPKCSMADKLIVIITFLNILTFTVWLTNTVFTGVTAILVGLVLRVIAEKIMEPLERVTCP